MTDSQDARAALDSVRASRLSLIEAADAPPSRHAAFAVLMGGLIAMPALPLAFRFAALAVALCAVPLIIRWDRRRTGMFINGYRRGQTRFVLAVVLLGSLALYSLSNWLALSRHIIWPSMALGLIGAIAGYFASQWWCRVFRREMAEL